MAGATGYARPEMIVETDWLADHLNDPNIRIVDCDERPAYTRAHIPGAVTFRVHQYIKDEANSIYVAPPDQVARIFGNLGIDENTEVITYDGFDSLYATRIWWVLSYYGHTKVRVLNGGWKKWLAEGRPIQREEPRVQAKSFTPRVNPNLLATVDQVVSSIGKAETCLLDVRTDEEWLGTEKRGTKRGGRIPGAIHLEWKHYMNRDGTWKPAQELQRMFSEAGIRPDQEIITY
ncbi:MAG TPA: rhodanese-like domain-containing protein [Dehalococcoidia bacterium]|nr:rhodanese-like domain-containing protein [Dehalococcoidia bacterium]